MDTRGLTDQFAACLSVSTESKKYIIRKKRSEISQDSFSSLTNLMIINQNLTRQISALKAEIAETQSCIVDLELCTLCPCCRGYDKAVVFTCRCVVCEGCAAEAVAGMKCGVCRKESVPLCGVKM